MLKIYSHLKTCLCLQIKVQIYIRCQVKNAESYFMTTLQKLTKKLLLTLKEILTSNQNVLQNL